MATPYPRRPVPFPPSLPLPYGGVYAPRTFRFPAEADASASGRWTLPRPCERGARHGTWGAYSWARETASGRYTIRSPRGRVLAGCTSWWRAAHVALRLSRMGVPG